jgi:hypothetical protein
VLLHKNIQTNPRLMITRQRWGIGYGEATYRVLHAPRAARHGRRRQAMLMHRAVGQVGKRFTQIRIVVGQILHIVRFRFGDGHGQTRHQRGCRCRGRAFCRSGRGRWCRLWRRGGRQDKRHFLVGNRGHWAGDGYAWAASRRRTQH